MPILKVIKAHSHRQAGSEIHVGIAEAADLISNGMAELLGGGPMPAPVAEMPDLAKADLPKLAATHKETHAAKETHSTHSKGGHK